MIRRHPLLFLLLLATAAPLAANSDLPTMGEPVDQVLSPRQEAEIGRAMMARARAELDLNQDPEIAAWIDDLGQDLARHSDAEPIDGFTFFVVRNPRINAFAGPGGYIGLHSGLILEARNEAQVAGVLAHEIAHVAQRHIARAYAAAERNSYKTLAAVLAGLIIGSQNPEAAQAAIATGVASEQQRRINYTRSNEYEADRVGIALLARAGYDPAGMTEFFEILMQSAGPGGDQVPEFLRTHPLSQNRIAESASRAASLKKSDQRRDSLEFHLMQARLGVLTSDRPSERYERRRHEPAPQNATAAAARRYEQGLLALRLERPAEALEQFNELHASAPENLHYGLARARAEHALGRGDAALETWRDMQALYPASYPVVSTGTELLLAHDRAAEAVDLVTRFLRRDEKAPAGAWRLLAEAAQAAGRPVRSHEALGEYYVRIDRLGEALTQLQIALDRAAAESPEYLRLEARIEQVQRLRRDQLARNPIDG